MATVADELAALPAVVGEMNYLGDPYRVEDGEILHYFADFSGTTNVRLAPSRVALRDARSRPEALTLDRQGIMIAEAPTLIRSFADADAIAGEYLAECEALIRKVTGAAQTWSQGPHCRFDGVADPKGRYDNRPTRFIHADYSDGAAANFAAAAPFDVSAWPRYAIYNLWRVVTPPPQSMPLALCDAQSIAPADEVETTVIMDYPDSEVIATQTTLYHPNPAHRWYYFSDMRPEEVLIFKSHDSDPGQPKRVPHSAFVDGNCPPGQARVSVEARVLGVFAA
jgi:hypothetical protein